MIQRLMSFTDLENLKHRWTSHKVIRKNRIHKFSPKFLIHLKKGRFTLKTVTTKDELISALKLRYEVFFKEMLGQRKNGLDADEFDAVCDHLVIIDNQSEEVIGTYRLNCTLYSDQFYSAGEFNIASLLKKEAVFVELGRACIHKDYRKGTIMSLLWRGIAEYMQATQANYFFGCGSIKTQDPHEAALLHRYFVETGRLSEEFHAPTTSKFTMPGLQHALSQFQNPLNAEEISRVQHMIPPLFSAYLRAGAMICGEPAYDEDFKCIDFLVLLNKDDLSGLYGKKYNMKAGKEV